MKTELKDVIHLYLGCEFKETLYYQSDLSFHSSQERKLTYKELDRWEKLPSVNIGKVESKPILRKLSDMTKEEIKALKMEMHDSINGENLLPPISSGPLINLFINKEDPKIILWLLKQGFDIFNLIETSQAIDKSTLI